MKTTPFKLRSQRIKLAAYCWYCYWKSILEANYQTRQKRPFITMPTSRIGRFGCSIVIVIWFTLLLTPCAMFWLASGNQVILHHANIPDPVFHPMLEIGLIMTVDHSGFQFTSASITNEDEQSLCVQTSVNYLLWQNRTREDPATVFCDCYTRKDEEASWVMDVTSPDECRKGT